MKTENHSPGRKSIRLQGYDYSLPGYYFVTICTDQRTCLFGEIKDGVMSLNALGEIVQEEWERTPQIRQEIQLDEFVVMPNHVHGIVRILSSAGRFQGPRQVAQESGGGDRRVARMVSTPGPGSGPSAEVPVSRRSVGMPPQGPSKRSLGSFLAGFKMSVTKRINQARNTPGGQVWQRNYYEHVIRGEPALERIRHYIRQNPSRWMHDRANRASTRTDAEDFLGIEFLD